MKYCYNFAQADSIIPPGVQGLDRYSYANNNPIRFIDPSGHISCSSVAEEDCRFEKMSWEEMYNITISSELKGNGLAILKAVSAAGVALSKALGGEASDAFRQVYGEVKFEKCTDCSGFGRTSSAEGGRSHTIYLTAQLYSGRDALTRNTRLVVHELGHAFNNVFGGRPSTDIPSNLLRDLFIAGTQNVGGIDYPIYGIQHGGTNNDFYGYAGDMGEWQFGFESSLPANEEIADMFVGWVYDSWGQDVDVSNSMAFQRMQHMAAFMPMYLGR